ncbi:hypothetical protein [Methanoregula sp.]|uniref:hypothetical protein n=1 Tax=Methanoregula sp. TaxID=2052170 RepID=UPI0025D18BB9|nr:hypothetical protein [Methanoregula sp.]
MSVKSAVFILILSACCMCLFAVPALAIYTTSDLGGSLVRGHQFIVDITGRPNTAYYIWLTGTWPLSGEAGDQPPVVVANQWNVQQDPENGPYTIGSYQYYNGGGRTILDDVAPSSSLLPKTSYYALVTTDASGQAVVAFGTSMNTALRSYSVRVENPTSINNETLLVQRGDTTVTRGLISIEAIDTRPTKPTVPPTTIPTLTQSPVPTSPETTVVTVPVTTPATTPMVPVETAIVIIALGAALCAARHR